MADSQQPAAPGPASERSHGQILKSSVIIGGSSLFNVGFSVVRMKVLALLLGPSGVGLLGLYTSIADVVRSMAGLGINNSGVRQIAEAVGSGDMRRVARTVTTLRRVAVFSGALGGILLAAFSGPVARLTFGDEQHAPWVALVGLVVFFMDVAAGQGALLQGMRRIGDMARISVLGAISGTVCSIGIVYIYYRHGAAEQGVVPALVCVAALGSLASWWYARKIKVDRTPLTLQEFSQETKALLQLGLVFMSTTLMSMGMAYLIRIILCHQLGVAAAGHYQAAWALSGFFIAFIVQAMGADFYPRLTAVAADNAECSRLVNEQVEVGLLLAGAGVVATLTLASWVIAIFYTAEFAPAVEVLRWMSLGMLLRVACWPMGFILVAKGAGKLFFWTEVASSLIQVGLVWGGVRWFGLTGTGIAFFGLYAVYFVGIYLIVNRLYGFRWSAANGRLARLFVPLVAGVFVGPYLLPATAAMILGGVATVFLAVHALRTLGSLIPQGKLPSTVQKILKRLGFAAAKTDS